MRLDLLPQEGLPLLGKVEIVVDLLPVAAEGAIELLLELLPKLLIETGHDEGTLRASLDLGSIEESFRHVPNAVVVKLVDVVPPEGS